jgi:hypothetical protein
LIKRYSQGLQFLLSYTWSKNLDYASAAASGGGAVGGPQATPLLGAARGPSGFDVPHRFVGSYVYELPGRDLKGILGAVLGGWQTNGILTLSSGRPFTVNMQNSVTNGAGGWPDRIGSGKLDNPTPDLWFDRAAFRAPESPRYGTSGRGILNGPKTQQFDAGFVKNFRFAERCKLQFRAEAFNLTNTPQFGFPNQNFDSPTGGKITSTVADNRDMQFALRLDF